MIFHRDFLKAVLGDEDGEDLLFNVVFAVVLIAAIGQGRGCESRVPL